MYTNASDKMYEDEIIYIRNMTRDDTDNIIRWRNSRTVMDSFIYRVPLTREVHLNWIDTMIKTGQVVQFVLGIKESGREIGSVYISHIDKERATGEFGIFIGEEDCQSKGYGTRGQKLIEQYAKDELGLSCMTLRVLKDNARAVHVYENNGYEVFKEDTVVIADGEDNISKDVVFMLKTL